jgi:mRNA degradation ribonuclease J1/J2
VVKALNGNGQRPARSLESTIKDVVSKYLYDETHRRPMVLAAVTQV